MSKPMDTIKSWLGWHLIALIEWAQLRLFDLIGESVVNSTNNNQFADDFKLKMKVFGISWSMINHQITWINLTVEIIGINAGRESKGSFYLSSINPDDQAQFSVNMMMMMMRKTKMMKDEKVIKMRMCMMMMRMEKIFFSPDVIRGSL